MPAPTRPPRSRLLSSAALVFAAATAWPFLAAGDAPALALRVIDPPVVAFDSTALGRATHSLRLSLTNQGLEQAKVEPLALHFRPVRDGVEFACEEPRSRDDRWPTTLDRGAAFSFSREVTCDTPLPGRYDVEILGRPRGVAAAVERTFGSFPLQVEPGSKPPVVLPWERSLHAAASGTKDMRPSKDPFAARIVVALINGTRAPVTLAPVRATMRVTRRGSSAPACAERGVDLAFAGTLAPGRSQSQSTPLGCDISTEALYDVEVSVANGAGTRVRLATHTIRVVVNTPTSPGQWDEPRGPIGGS
jgi:hypothetical protein